jgi:hypothetical protein
VFLKTLVVLKSQAMAASVEVYVNGASGVDIEVIEDAGWDSQRAIFTMTAAEATRMKEFLIKQGY